jgi:iron complex outermembrane receptor protein
MVRVFLPFLFVFTVAMHLRGQIAPEDTVAMYYNLGEVKVCGEKDSSSTEFDFYKNSRLATTEDILSRMPGVNLIRRGAFGLEPTLRNYNAGQTNITIDGMRIYGACTDKMDPVSIYIEPINLHAVEVSHGAAGALAGSTVGGQINLNLKSPETACSRKPGIQLAHSFNSVNLGKSSSLRFQQSLKRLDSRLSITHRRADDYRSGAGEVVPYSGFEKLNLNASVVYHLDTLQILRLDYLGDWGKNIGFPALPMDVGRAEAQIVALTHTLQSNQNPSFFNELKVYFNTIYHQMDDTHRPEAPMHMDMPGRSETIGFYNEVNFRKDFRIRIDFHRAYTFAEMTMYPLDEPQMYLQTLPENYLDDYGLAISKLLTWEEGQELKIQGRIDYFSQFSNSDFGARQWEVFGQDISEERRDLLKNLTFSYTKVWESAARTKFTLSYGERVPTNNERYGFYLYNRQDQFDYVGNIRLNPERSIQAELMFYFEEGRFSFTTNVFYHRINDLIYAQVLEGFGQMTIGALGLKTYKNIPFANSFGSELSFSAVLSDKLSHIAALRYVYSETNFSEPMPLVPPLKLQQALRFRHNLWVIQAEHDFAASQRRINVDYGDRRTPGFNLFSVRASRNFPYKSMVFQGGFAVENIFDTSYREHLDIGSILRYGRNFQLNVGVML